VEDALFLLNYNMKVSIGDIVDRYSICKLKSERTSIDCSSELHALETELKNYEGINEYVCKLYGINGDIWNLEADIRKGNEDVLGLEEVGRRAIQIRQFNGQRVSVKNEINSFYKEGFVETKINHGSQKQVPIVVTLSTVPERLRHIHSDGLPLVVKSLCEQTYKDYEVHFNIPEIYKPNGTPYVIPEWLSEYQLKYPHLKVFRTEDFGPPTKLLPTLHRIQDPEAIIIVVDDDLVYHNELVQEHFNHNLKINNAGFGYDGRSNCDEHRYNDLRDAWVLCIDRPTKTHIIQHYKSASYRRKYFESDFFEHFLGKTRSDDILISYYLRFKDINLFIMPYEKDLHMFDTPEKWQKHQGVETFPVLRHANMPGATGCTNPDMLKVEDRFYTPPIFETWLREKKIVY
jgi:hypothetical protein